VAVGRRRRRGGAGPHLAVHLHHLSVNESKAVVAVGGRGAVPLVGWGGVWDGRAASRGEVGEEETGGGAPVSGSGRGYPPPRNAGGHEEAGSGLHGPF
jgi:hypothetical protein